MEYLNKALLAGGSKPHQVARTTILYLFAIYLLRKAGKKVAEKGLKAAMLEIGLDLIDSVPLAGALVDGVVDKEIQKEVAKLECDLIHPYEDGETKHTSIPEEGISRDKLLKLVTKWADVETSRWEKGQISGSIYHGGKDHYDFLELFPYTRRMEAEIVRMTCSLFNGDEGTTGLVTSGGTESLIMACLAYRNKAYSQGIKHPRIICCTSTHAALDKAAHYFKFELIRVPMDKQTFKVDIRGVEKAINKNTVALFGSAPQYPQGIVDDLISLSELAIKNNIGLHVDACLGGFILPFAVMAGYEDIPLFDFRIPGVTSISADTHKYGYGSKGSSVVMYRTKKLKRFQYFLDTKWCGGIYASPSIPGSKAGQPIAQTWASLVSIGKDGYIEIARQIMETARAIKAGITEMKELDVQGDPLGSVIGFESCDPKIDIFAVMDAMKELGWHLNALQYPVGLHICVTRMSMGKHELFLKDLATAVKNVKENPEKYKGGSAGLYGLAIALPEKHLNSIACGFMDSLVMIDPSQPELRKEKVDIL